MDRFPPRMLVLITVALLLIVTGGVFIAAKSHMAPAVTINYTSHPTIGNPKARVHIVVFEEPKCVNCAKLNDELFPKIKRAFVDSNKATYTVIPVSFLSGSMPAATALLCVYNQDPLYPNSELYFDYLDYMYSNQPPETEDWATTERLIAMAKKTSPAINPGQLRKCIDAQTYRIRIQKNTELGKKVMGGSIATPTMFINGVEVKSLTFDEIEEMVEEIAP
ncbi:MAG: Disulfide bond formation protein D [Chlamydiales bacterium]|nr:Disulfide bond formation protein D [Chlamydiales bacterium]MCH9635873.1 Disulfide bond formation protein D [Chlamydiales bacterium]MCH9704389.1 DsbA family protein [Chlamydiota bacterium]